jgi:hypothetical protein
MTNEMNDLLQAVAAERGELEPNSKPISTHSTTYEERSEALQANYARMHEALKRIARYDVGLQSLIEDGADTPENRAKYYEGRVEYRRSIARAALPEAER